MKCTKCEYESKPGRWEKRNYDMHVERKHGEVKFEPVSAVLSQIASETATAPTAPTVQTILTTTQEAPTEPVEVTFYAPRHPFMTVIVRPTEWKQGDGPAGSHWYPVEGLIAEFDQGRFTTSDPVVIAYLEGDKAQAKALGLVDKNGNGRVYNDHRSPILSNRQIKAMAAKEA